MEKGFEWDLESGSVAVVPHGHELLEGLEHVDGRGARRQGEGSGREREREREEGRYEWGSGTCSMSMTRSMSRDSPLP